MSFVESTIEFAAKHPELVKAAGGLIKKHVFSGNEKHDEEKHAHAAAEPAHTGHPAAAEHKPTVIEHKPGHDSFRGMAGETLHRLADAVSGMNHPIELKDAHGAGGMPSAGPGATHKAAQPAKGAAQQIR